MRWPLVTRKTADRLVEENRRMIYRSVKATLDAGGRVVFDDEHLQDEIFNERLCVLGDRVTITDCTFGPGVYRMTGVEV